MQPKWGQLLGYLALTNGTVLALYLPWIMVMVTQLTTDASYWEGVLKVDEAVRRVIISFVYGETGLESDIQVTLVPIVLITLLLFLALLPNRAQGLETRQRSWRMISFGLLWFVAPVTITLLLAILCLSLMLAT